MPAQRGQSPLLAKLGPQLDKAVKAHANDEVDYGFEMLPPIPAGVAQLVSCKFDTYKAGPNKGEYYFQARGVILEPKEVQYNGVAVPVAGRQTMINKPLCATKKADGTVVPLDDNVAVVLNEMKKLGVDTANAGGADLETLAEALQQTRPYLRFSVSVKTPRPNTQDKEGRWENWHGTRGLENYTPPEDVDVQDETGGAATDEAGDQPPADYTDQADLDSLANLADEQDAAAQNRLTELAQEVGVATEADAAGSWAEVVELIRNAAPAPNGKGKGGKAGPKGKAPPKQEEPEDAGGAPAKGDVWLYRPDPKRKPAEHEVLATYPKTRTADVQDLADKKKVFKGVSWDKLQPPA